MRNIFVNLVKLVLSVALLIYTEKYFYNLLDFLKINTSNIDSNVISLIVYILIMICILIIYRAEIKDAFNKYDKRKASNFLYTVVSFVVLFIGMILVNYLCKILAMYLDVSYTQIAFKNIFNKSISMELIIMIVKDIILVPFIVTIIFVLGVNNLLGGKNSSMVSGLVYAGYKACFARGSVLYAVINVFPYFAFALMLSLIYKRNNNIAFSIFAFILYELFGYLLLGRIGG